MLRVLARQMILSPALFGAPYPGSTSGLAASAPRARASRTSVKTLAAKQLHFNTNGEALKRMQAGVDKLATVVGVTLGPKGRNVVLESK